MRKYYLTLFLVVADLTGLLFSFWLAYWLRYGVSVLMQRNSPPSPYSLFYLPLLAVGLWMLLLVTVERQEIPSVFSYAATASRVIMPYSFFVMSFLAMLFLTKVDYSRLLLAFFFSLFFLLLLVIRHSSRGLLAGLRRHGIGLRRVGIVGDSELAQELARRIRQHPELHYEIVGFLTPAAGGGRPDDRNAIVGTSDKVAAELAQRRVNELIFVIPIRRDSETLDFIASCQKYGIAIKSVPEYYEMHAHQIKSLSIDGIPILELKDMSQAPAYRMLKRVIDVSLSGLLLILFSPVMLIISLMLRVSGSRKILRREGRIGLSGRPFEIYRFDIERPDPDSREAEKLWGARFREFLDRYSLSELPQLWNIFRGEMSLVGPRPEPPERVRHYSDWHRRRLQLKPGITGLAQVQGLRGADSSDEKTRYDLEYAANLSPFLDLSLIFATLGTLAKRGRAKPATPPAPPDLGLRPSSFDHKPV